MGMDDIEKIVVYMILNKCESAQAQEIQKWTRFSDNRIMTALMSCENTIFHIDKNPDNPDCLSISLIQGPEKDRILKKYGDIIGIKKAKI
jgi:hypothetical protein